MEKREYVCNNGHNIKWKSKSDEPACPVCHKEVDTKKREIGGIDNLIDKARDTYFALRYDGVSQMSALKQTKKAFNCDDDLLGEFDVEYQEEVNGK